MIFLSRGPREDFSCTNIYQLGEVITKEISRIGNLAVNLRARLPWERIGHECTRYLMDPLILW